MSMQHVDEAIRHFYKHWSLLAVESSNDIDECILLASDEGRLRFVRAMLEEIISDQDHISEAITLGGLRAIVDPCATMLPYSLFAESVSENEREEVVDKMHTVFAEIFTRKCEPLLTHLAPTTISPWNSLCYMWWEVLPRHGVPRVSYLDKIDLTIVELMGNLLSLEHIACKEAALHGLGLWQIGRGEDVRRVIDIHSDTIPSALWDYALMAKTGNLQ